MKRFACLDLHLSIGEGWCLLASSLTELGENSSTGLSVSSPEISTILPQIVQHLLWPQEPGPLPCSHTVGGLNWETEEMEKAQLEKELNPADLNVHALHFSKKHSLKRKSFFWLGKLKKSWKNVLNQLNLPQPGILSCCFYELWSVGDKVFPAVPAKAVGQQEPTQCFIPPTWSDVWPDPLFAAWASVGHLERGC